MCKMSKLPIQKLFVATGLLVLAACNSSTGGNTTDTLGVSGNSSDPETDAAVELENLRAFCPKSVVRAGTETLRRFSDGVSAEDPDALNSLRFQATITEAVRECNYSPTMLNIRVGVAGRAINGPVGETGSFETPIRIAVTNGVEVQYSQLHNIVVTIPPGRTNATFRFVDNNVNIPIPDKRNLVIYVGYDEGPSDDEKPKKKLQPVN